MPEPAGRLRSLVRAVPVAVRRDYAGTAVVQWSTMAVHLLLFHLVARRGGAPGFAYYQVARGVVAWLQPLALAGLGTAVQRCLPRAGAAATGLARRAFGVQVLLVAVVSTALLVPAGRVGELLGLTGGASAVAAIAMLLGGNAACTMTVAVLRGTGQVRYANITALTGFAIVPVVAFVPPAPIETFVVRYGLGMAVVALSGIACARQTRPSTVSTVPPPAPAPGEPPPTLAALLRYGGRRIVGDLALPGILAFPTVAVGHARPGGPEAGYVGFATSAVTLVCALFGMLTPVLLPRLSAHFHRDGGGPELRRALVALPLGAAGLALLSALPVALAAPVLVHRFLGAEFGPTAGVLRLGLLAAPPLAMFYAARPTLDALRDAPVTARLTVGCLALQVLLTAGLTAVLDVAVGALLSFVLAAWTLGATAWLAVRRETVRRTP